MDNKTHETFAFAEAIFAKFDEEDETTDRQGEATEFLLRGLVKKYNLKPFSKKHKELLANKTYIIEEDDYLKIYTVRGAVPKNVFTQTGWTDLMSRTTASYLKKFHMPHGTLYLLFPVLHSPQMIFTNHFFDRYNQRFAKTCYSRKEVLTTFIKTDFLNEVPAVRDLAIEDGNIKEARIAYKTGVGFGHCLNGIILMMTYVDSGNLTDFNADVKEGLDNEREWFTTQAIKRNVKNINNMRKGECTCGKCKQERAAVSELT